MRPHARQFQGAPASRQSLIPPTSLRFLFCGPDAPPRAASPASYRQALILTHELADGGHFNDYLVRKLAPLRPLLSLGRAARAWPPAKVNHAVMHWWRDSAPQHSTPPGEPSAPGGML